MTPDVLIKLPERWEQYIKRLAGSEGYAIDSAIHWLYRGLDTKAAQAQARLEALVGDVVTLTTRAEYRSPVLDLVMHTFSHLYGDVLVLREGEQSLDRFMSDSVDFSAPFPEVEHLNYTMHLRPKHLYYNGKVWALQRGEQERYAIEYNTPDFASTDPLAFTPITTRGTHIRVKGIGLSFTSESLYDSLVPWQRIAYGIRAKVVAGELQEIDRG